MLVVIIGLVVYLNVKAPLLMNPFEVVSRLDSGTLQQSSLEVMAVLLPIMSIVVCFLLVVCVALMYVGLSNEKKYLGMLEKMKKDAPALEKNGDIVKSVG
ncbi:MAG: hypothetical protein SWE60_07660 [Thermodesulfobacteriota bacterium]|nr:hypothetical protein [Thermodesulfobacteriota bacterium]